MTTEEILEKLGEIEADLEFLQAASRDNGLLNLNENLRRVGACVRALARSLKRYIALESMKNA